MKNFFTLVLACLASVALSAQCDVICPDDITVDCDGYAGAHVSWDEPSFNATCDLGTDCGDAPNIYGFIYAGTYNGSHYYCSYYNYTWEDANVLCQNNGGYLASINDAAENEYIRNFIMTSSAWIGYNDLASEGNFEWVNGDPSGYENWQYGQPNNLYGAEHYTRIKKNGGQWTDRDHTIYYECVMEIPCSSGGWQQTAGPAPGSFFTGGTTTTVSYEYVDDNGTVYNCDFDVTVNDCACVECPDSLVLACDPNINGAVLDLPEPSFDPACNINPTDCSNAPNIYGFIYAGTYNGSHYYCSYYNYTWEDANVLCQNNGGYLASINDAAENEYIRNFIMTSSAWIGYNDLASEGNFEWVNGDPSGYENWQYGQPNNLYGSEHYTRIKKYGGEWTDRDHTIKYECVMEIPCASSEWVQVSGPTDGTILPGGTVDNVTFEFDYNGHIFTCSYPVIVEACGGGGGGGEGGGGRFANEPGYGCDDMICEFKASPNPTSGLSVISFFTEQNLEYATSIYTATGKQLTEIRQVSEKGMNYNTVDFSSYDTGIYFINLEMRGETQTIKVIKN